MSESKVLGWFVAVPIILLCAGYGVLGVVFAPWIAKPIALVAVVVGLTMVYLIVRDLRGMKA